MHLPSESLVWLTNLKVPFMQDQKKKKMKNLRALQRLALVSVPRSLHGGMKFSMMKKTSVLGALVHDREFVSHQCYSMKSHAKTAVFISTYLHEAFIANIDELVELLNKNDAHSLNWHEFQAFFEAFKTSLKAQAKLEEVGFVPAIHEFVSENNEKSDLLALLDLKTNHLLESQVITHIEHLIKHHQHHQDPSHSKIEELKKSLSELRNTVEEHFQKKEKAFLPVGEQYLSHEELVKIQSDALLKLMEQDESSHQILHYYSFSNNSLDLSEAMLRQMLAAKNSNPKVEKILKEFKRSMPKEVWLQMTVRIPEMGHI